MGATVSRFSSPTERRFDGRVAVITGAGRGLGREYALLLAARGAKVLIDDNGSELDGSGGDAAVARDVAAEIVAAGGDAIACSVSVDTPAGGREIVEAALDTWGRIDILIHSAGNHRYDSFAEVSYEAFRSVLDTHVMGAFNVAQPAFARMAAAGYGRIVLTGSLGGLYTMPNTVHYSTAKAAMIGLNNSIAIEGADQGVKSNVIIPAALTRTAEGVDRSNIPPMTAAMAAPLAGYLAHEDCAVTGEFLLSVAGRVARAYIAETRGEYRPYWTIDTIADNVAAIRDPSESFSFHPAQDGFFEHLTESFAMARGERQGLPVAPVQLYG